jgi:hypothetical protein
MYYPTVTQRQVRMEPIGHDPFIDNLAEPSPAPAPDPAAAQRSRRLAARRRMHGARSERRPRARLT